MTIRHEGGREHPDADVCWRCVGEVAEQRDAARAELAALRERAEGPEAERQRLVQRVEFELTEHERAAARVALLEGLLREAVEGLSFCPLCGDGDPNHLPDCLYVAVLADGG